MGGVAFDSDAAFNIAVKPAVSLTWGSLPIRSARSRMRSSTSAIPMTSQHRLAFANTGLVGLHQGRAVPTCIEYQTTQTGDTVAYIHDFGTAKGPEGREKRPKPGETAVTGRSARLSQGSVENAESDSCEDGAVSLMYDRVAALPTGSMHVREPAEPEPTTFQVCNESDEALQVAHAWDNGGKVAGWTTVPGRFVKKSPAHPLRRPAWVVR